MDEKHMRPREKDLLTSDAPDENDGTILDDALTDVPSKNKYHGWIALKEKPI